MRQKRLDFARAYIFRVALAVIVNIASNPIRIGLLGSNTVMLHAQLIAHFVQQFGGICRGAFIGNFGVYHNFSARKNKALQIQFQFIHLEGAFQGIF